VPDNYLNKNVFPVWVAVFLKGEHDVLVCVLPCRIRRDIVERGRDVLAVLDQYESTVKPSFESFILPTKQYADIIVPRGGDNTVAIDLLLQHIRLKLIERASSRSSSRASNLTTEDVTSSTVTVVSGSQVAASVLGAAAGGAVERSTAMV
jgi:hypothetical protein